MSFSKVAVVGATGNIGQHITNALLQIKPISTTILTRPDSLTSKKDLLDKFTAAGGKVIPVDFKDPQALAKALGGIEVVISAAAGNAILDQIPIITAAKTAGVKRFYPSEYGIDDVATSYSHPAVEGKKQIRKAVIDAGLQVVITFTGLFQDWIFSPFYSVDQAKSTIEIVGDGNTKFGGWTCAQIGQVVAQSVNHKVTKPVPGQSTYYIRAHGTITTWNQVVSDFESVSGTKWTRNYITIEQAEEKAKQNPAEFGTVVRLWIAKGLGQVQENCAKEFDVKPTPFVDFFKAILAK